MDGITRISHDAERLVCGTGHVILSSFQDRETYINSCFSTNKVTILTERQEIVRDCVVSKNAWQHLEFPEDQRSRGSQVVWINIPYQNAVIILDILHKKDELNKIRKSNCFKFEKRVDDNLVTITGDGETGTLYISTQGTGVSEGEVYIKILNESELGVFNLYIQGVIEFNIERDFNLRVGNEFNLIVRDDSNPSAQANLKYTLGTGLTYLDEFNNNIRGNNEGLYQEVPSDKKVYVRATNASSEPVLLGNQAVDFLNEMKNLLDSIVTTLNAAAPIGSSTVSASPITAKTISWKASISKLNNKIKFLKTKNFEAS